MNNYLDITKTYDDEKIKEFSNIIKNGGIGIFPTETVYAIEIDSYYGLQKKHIEQSINIFKTQEDSKYVLNPKNWTFFD